MQEAYVSAPLGVTREECASHPGLLLDLSTSTLRRRYALIRGLLSLLGGSAKEKVLGRLVTARNAMSRFGEIGEYTDLDDISRMGRDALTAVAELEQSVYSLTSAHVKRAVKASTVKTSPLAAKIGGPSL